MYLTPPDMKVKMDSIHFDGTTATWHQSLMQQPCDVNVLYDWKVYKIMLQERFEDICDDPIAELKKLQETDGIVDYHEKFELIKTRVNLPEDYLVSAYLAGLRLDTQMHVQMFQPQTIRQCLLLGRLYEKAHPQKVGVNNWGANKQMVNNQGDKGFYSSKKENPYSKTTTHEVGSYNETKKYPRKFMSQEEMSARRAKGLCYFCDEKLYS